LCEPMTHAATFFTWAFGLIPAYTTSTYCQGCLTRYHLTCFVRDDIRTYYTTDILSSSAPIQISTHYFVDQMLCEWFADSMTLAWTSGQNCSNLYNKDAKRLPWSDALPLAFPTRFVINGKDVWEAFTINALMEWHRDHGTLLQVPHRAAEPHICWYDAVQARNQAMVGPGQPAWNHACNVCMKHLKDDNGRIYAVYRSAVTDGISLGHPCCAVHDCKEALPTSKHHFCTQHSLHINVCAVEVCSSLVKSGLRTCRDPTHSAAETRYKEHGTAMFQLRQRLACAHQTSSDPERNGAPGPVDSLLSLAIEVFARFGRRQTHNEQLCVASCGVILARAMFYGAEGPNSVRLFWMGAFPTKLSILNVMWHDNNCSVAAMLAREKDTYFDKVALPVDVFHFKSKHKEKDGFCGLNCNPALFPELMDPATGKWLFNSSAAEQVNVWFGGFCSITRLMHAERFNFFLDEVIMCRNRDIILKLEEAGHAPYLIPRSDLLG
ncbi:hypothetical protein K439DRAFT_1267774, partial [Ramaria rubella]